MSASSSSLPEADVGAPPPAAMKGAAPGGGELTQLTLRAVKEEPSSAATAAASASAAAAPADDGFKLRGLPFALVMFAMCLAVFIGGLDGTIVVVAMPQIAQEFNALGLISWIFLSFLLTQTAGGALPPSFRWRLPTQSKMLRACRSAPLG